MPHELMVVILVTLACEVLAVSCYTAFKLGKLAGYKQCKARNTICITQGRVTISLPRENIVNWLNQDGLMLVPVGPDWLAKPRHNHERTP